ncbi:MAG: TRAP transporter substrate-binding protein [Acidimicrobiales bacterium]
MTQEIQETEEGVDRRSFLARAGLGAAGLAAGGALLAACGDDDSGGAGGTADGGDDASGDDDATTVDLAQDDDLPDIEWEMATSWPLSLDTLFGGAETFTTTLAALTGGKFMITPRAGGELVGGLEVLPAVSNGGVQVGHTASYYYVGLNPATQFGTAVPFGLNSRQQNAWLYEGGGLELLRDFYAEEFGVIQFPAGNTGVQMGGWFGKSIDTPDDLNGLTMRIPGLAGQVLNRLGGEQVTLPGGEIVTSIETGAIDAAEWVGPYDDLNLGLDQLGDDAIYYYPGWWEPGPTLEVQIPLNLWNDLPGQYQAAVEASARTANISMMANYDVLNPEALKELRNRGIDVRPFSESLLEVFRETTEEVLDDTAAANSDFASILEPWRQFRDDIQAWHALAEATYLISTVLDS